MPPETPNPPVILVTGGTSGLGLEIVRNLLDRNCIVVATGRKPPLLNGYEHNFRFYRIDFNDLEETADVIKTICNNHPISHVINNAGILSPPDFRTTNDGNEYTFQVNFLAHLLINEVIIKRFGHVHQLKIIAVTSVIYKLAKPDLNYARTCEDYNPVKAYSYSKLFMIMMCRHLNLKYNDLELKCISFVPGVFGSSIFRMQKGWFRFLYRVASPFMRRPSFAAKVLAEILTENDFDNGEIYDFRKRLKSLKEKDPETVRLFWDECYSMLRKYLD